MLRLHRGFEEASDSSSVCYRETVSAMNERNGVAERGRVRSRVVGDCLGCGSGYGDSGSVNSWGL